MGYINYKLLGKREHANSKEAFNFYRAMAKHRHKPTNSEKKHLATIMNSIYSKIRDAAIDYEGGVYAPNFFYIIPQPYPNKKLIKILQAGGEYRSTMNLHTKGLIYTLVFVNLLPKKQHKLWDLSNSYFTEIRKKLSEKLKTSKPKYLFSLDTLRKTQ